MLFNELNQKIPNFQNRLLMAKKVFCSNGEGHVDRKDIVVQCSLHFH